MEIKELLKEINDYGDDMRKQAEKKQKEHKEAVAKYKTKVMSYIDDMREMQKVALATFDNGIANSCLFADDVLTSNLGFFHEDSKLVSPMNSNGMSYATLKPNGYFGLIGNDSIVLQINLGYKDIISCFQRHDGMNIEQDKVGNLDYLHLLKRIACEYPTWRNNVMDKIHTAIMASK